MELVEIKKKIHLTELKPKGRVPQQVVGSGEENLCIVRQGRRHFLGHNTEGQKGGKFRLKGSSDKK